MLTNIVFVFCMTAVSSVSLGISPEEVKYLVKDIAQTIRSKHVLTFYRIKENEEVLSNLTGSAKENIKDNMIALGESYWAKIEAFGKVAATSGVNISECIKDGNERFDTLSEASVEEPLYKISLLEDEGNATISSALSQADRILEELSSLEEKVNACSDEECATTLEADVGHFLKDSVTLFEQALKKAYEFAQVNLEARLKKISFDTSAYVEAYQAILDDVSTCIKSLRITLEEAKYLVKDIADTIRSKHVHIFYRIKENEEVLKNLTGSAADNIKANLTAVAEPYWEKIESFKKEAETSGKNISKCVNDGNQRFDTLSEAVVEEPLYKISLLEEEGNKQINKALNQADKILEELSSLEEKVNACTEENCASATEIEAEQFLKYGVKVLQETLKKPYEFAQVELKIRLETISINSTIYVKAYNAILRDIATCIQSE